MFLYSAWCDLPISTRIKIAGIFGIVKRGSTEVFNNQIKSDGYVVKEIEQALNVDALQWYLETDETDMLALWHGLVDKIEERVNVPVVSQTPEEIPIVIKKQRGRPKKQ